MVVVPLPVVVLLPLADDPLSALLLDALLLSALLPEAEPLSASVLSCVVVLPCVVWLPSVLPALSCDWLVCGVALSSVCPELASLLDAAGLLSALGSVEDAFFTLLVVELVVLAVAAFCEEISALCEAADFGLALGFTVVLMTLNPLIKIMSETIAAGDNSGAVRYAMNRTPFQKCHVSIVPLNALR